MTNFRKWALWIGWFCLWIVFSSDGIAAEGKLKKLFLDTLDQHPDLSEFLRTRYGFALMPILITEPAIGYGGGGGLVFIHRTPEEIARGGGVYPSITGIGGFYTETNSWALGAGHLGIWKDGRLRYRGGVGYGSFHLRYYREPVLPGGIRQIGFNIVAYGFVQELVAQLGNSHFFAGASYTFGQTTVNFDAPVQFPEILTDELDSRIGGVGAVLYFDNRDNMFTPNAGMYAGIEYIYNDNWLGSEKTFHRLFSYWLIYQKLHPQLLGALRLDFQNSSDGTPFYLRPFISLRGIPAMRYQGKTTYLVEGELRWDFTYRWSLVGFGGYGEALPINNDLFKKQSAYNVGAGFRYLIARLYGLRMGVDVARGPEEWAFYIQFGNAWFRY